MRPERNRPPLRIREAGGRAIGAGVDVRDEAAIARAVHEAVEAFGGVDALVTCAGVMHNVSVEDETSEGWDRILDTNLKGAFLISKHVLPHMRRRGRGSIVHIGSVTGIMGYTHLAAYCASKGGIHSLTRAMAIEYPPRHPSQHGRSRHRRHADPRRVFGGDGGSPKGPGVL